jgi:hypothetical protein
LHGDVRAWWLHASYINLSALSLLASLHRHTLIFIPKEKKNDS